MAGRQKLLLSSCYHLSFAGFLSLVALGQPAEQCFCSWLVLSSELIAIAVGIDAAACASPVACRNDVATFGV